MNENYSNQYMKQGQQKHEAKKEEKSEGNEAFEKVESFDDMNLKEDLLHGIYSYGYEKPSQVQQRAIMPICTGTKNLLQHNTLISQCLTILKSFQRIIL